MFRQLSILILCASSAAAIAAEPDLSTTLLSARCAEADSQGNCSIYHVSVVELIGNPVMFHGKLVRLVGYTRLEFERNAIYLSKESYDAGITKDALWLFPPARFDLPKKGWGPHYAIVEGRFDAAHQGHRSLYSGAITETTRIDEWNASK